MIVSADQAVQYITQCAKAGLVPMLSGSPGIGKSAIVKGIQEAHNLALVDIRLSMLNPEDIMGFGRIKDLPDEEAVAQFVPFDLFPLKGRDTPPAGRYGWLVFLDELSSAHPAVQAPCYKILHDRQVGGYDLHPNVVLVAAGNLLTDGAIVNRLGTAMQSRLVHLELAVQPKAWIKWANTAGIDHRVMAFIEHNPELLMNFDPKHNDKTFSCPRTWEYLSRLIKGIASKDLQEYLPLLAGTVGEGSARQFITHVEIYAKLPTYREIVKDPLNARMDSDPAMLFGVAYMVGAFMDAATLVPAMEYLDRLPVEFQTICLQNAIQRDKSLIRQQPITKWIAVKGANLL